MAAARSPTFPPFFLYHILSPLTLIGTFFHLYFQSYTYINNTRRHMCPILILLVIQIYLVNFRLKGNFTTFTKLWFIFVVTVISFYWWSEIWFNVKSGNILRKIKSLRVAHSFVNKCISVASSINLVLKLFQKKNQVNFNAGNHFELLNKRDKVTVGCHKYDWLFFND